MSKQKLLRAWHKKEKKMFDVAGLEWIGARPYGLTDWKDEPDVNIFRKDKNQLEWCTAKEVELMDYIGFNDKNRKKIFEGDVLEVRIEDDCNVYVPSEYAKQFTKEEINKMYEADLSDEEGEERFRKLHDEEPLKVAYYVKFNEEFGTYRLIGRFLNNDGTWSDEDYWDDDVLSLEGDDYEVLGNIHENPEFYPPENV